MRRASPFERAAAPPGVRLLITAELASPALFGLRDPAILLPAEASGWTAERLRAVLAHEMAHVERRDCALELLVQFACALHWYNPLLWRAARQMRDRARTRLRRTRRRRRPRRARLCGGSGPGRAPAFAPPPARAARHGAAARARAQGAPPARAAAAGRWPRPAARPAHLVGAPHASLLLAAVTAPAAGLLGSGSVQPAAGPAERPRRPDERARAARF